MPAALKRKSSDEEFEARPTKNVKLDMNHAPAIFSNMPQLMQDVDMMDADMDVDIMTPGSLENSPSTPPATTLPSSYPTLKIYPPLNPLDSSTPLDTPTAQLPFFDVSTATTPSSDVYPQKTPELLKPLVSPNSTCNCERIPRLQMSCPKPNGNRSLWSFCDGCGAIGIVA